jgi:hypothetical protein
VHAKSDATRHRPAEQDVEAAVEERGDRVEREAEPQGQHVGKLFRVARGCKTERTAASAARWPNRMSASDWRQAQSRSRSRPGRLRPGSSRSHGQGRCVARASHAAGNGSIRPKRVTAVKCATSTRWRRLVSPVRSAGSTATIIGNSVSCRDKADEGRHRQPCRFQACHA